MLPLSLSAIGSKATLQLLTMKTALKYSFTATKLPKLVIDGGHRTNTTKSRLNAILKVHCIEGECVFQENFEWFIHKFIGQAGQSKVYNKCDFKNGFILS